MSGKNVDADRTVLVYNWSDPPVSSCKIFFSHPVRIHSVFRNDSSNTGLGYGITHEDKVVTIQLDEPVPQRRQISDEIKMKFTATNKYVKMDKFFWFANKDTSGTEKIASPAQLKKFNEYFYILPPPPPVIKQPKDGESSWRDAPEIRGNAKPNYMVAVYVDGNKQEPLTKSNEDSFWSFQVSIPLSLGDHTFAAKLVDSDGSESEESAPIRYTVRPLPQPKPTR